PLSSRNQLSPNLALHTVETRVPFSRQPLRCSVSSCLRCSTRPLTSRRAQYYPPRRLRNETSQLASAEHRLIGNSPAAQSPTRGGPMQDGRRYAWNALLR